MIILVISGILAALLLFRWTRTLALLVIAGLVITMAVRSNQAKSEEVQMAVCYPGNYQYHFVAPKGMCQVFETGGRFMEIGRYQSTSITCTNYILAHSKSPDPRWPAMVQGICLGIWQDKLAMQAAAHPGPGHPGASLYLGQ